MTGPPKEVEGRAPHRDRPSTNDFSSHHATHNRNADHTGRTPSWLGSALERRRRAAHRLVPLACGCADPWPHRCNELPLTVVMVDAGRAAAEHILRAGCIPLVETEVLRALWRRGGDDRAFAERLHQLTGGLVA